jgi:hypothetical protein
MPEKAVKNIGSDIAEGLSSATAPPAPSRYRAAKLYHHLWTTSVVAGVAGSAATAVTGAWWAFGLGLAGLTGVLASIVLQLAARTVR